ncbi:hypothetical protein LZC95_49615 [Pendulispora brunnea]|uniref:Uncharacterized protein n=1 Tax=Pendulispora brunnea TaxID=2905690 RepID=A0ABZ2KAU0_9BACT
MRDLAIPFEKTWNMASRPAEGRLLMNPLQNLPVLLREKDGAIIAECPLLPGCSCKSLSRLDALRTMQRLLKRVVSSGLIQEIEHTRYEVVHVAVSDPVDEGQPTRARSVRTPGGTKHAA